ncbi:MAG: endonuclease III [Nitrosomonadales bacterium]
MNANKRECILAKLKANTPEPTTELKFNSPYQLLIAVILSAQTTDIQVNKVTQKLFKIAPNERLLSSLDISVIEEIINSIGLYKTKAKNILQTSIILNQEYNGVIPKTREELVKLPGVGRKTANVFLNTIHKIPVIAVDTHIFRVSNRIGLCKGKNVLEVEKKLTKLLPKNYLVDAHHLLILHGRYICKARNPECSLCCIENFCEYKSKSF